SARAIASCPAFPAFPRAPPRPAQFSPAPANCGIREPSPSYRFGSEHMSLAWRLSAGAALGFAVVAACAGAPPQNVGSTPADDLVKRDAEERAKRVEKQ